MIKTFFFHLIVSITILNILIDSATRLSHESILLLSYLLVFVVGDLIYRLFLQAHLHFSHLKQHIFDFSFWVSIMILLGFTIYLHWTFLSFCILLFFLSALWLKIPSEIAFFCALLILILVPFYLIVNQQNIAEQLSIYVYYFLCIGAVLSIKESMNFKR